MAITDKLNDVVQNAAGIDLGEVKKKIEDADGIIGKAQALDKSAAGPLAKNLEDLDKAIDKNRVDTRSIIARSRNSVLQFPVYISQSVPVNPAHVIARLYDRVYASFVQAVLSMHPIISEKEANEMLFLRRFHTNINEAVQTIINEYYRPIDEIDAMIQESVFYKKEIIPGCILECAWVPMSDNDIKMESARASHDLLDGFTYLKESDRIEKEVSWADVSQKELEQIAQEYWGRKATDEDDAAQMAREFAKDVAVAQRVVGKNAKMSPDDLDDEDQDRYDRMKKEGKLSGMELYRNINGHIRKNQAKTKKIVNANDIMKAADAPVLLKDGDIKRANGMVPWTIQATFRVRDSSGNIGYEVKYIIGIKSTLHLISPKDLSSELQDLMMGDNKGLRKVRYKTGELTFMNYIFNIKGLKADAAKQINYNKRWINTLKRLSDYQKRNGSLKLTPHVDVIPNATLVLTHQDVINLANDTGIDLSVVSNAKRLAKSLFLISIAILDATAGTMRVLFPDRDNDWDVQSIASIDAELAKTDNSKMMNELNRLINKR